MIEQAGKPSTDQHKLVVFTLLVIIGFVFTYTPRDYLTMDSPIRAEVAAGEVLDMHLGELIDYSIKAHWQDTMRDEERKE